VPPRSRGFFGGLLVPERPDEAHDQAGVQVGDDRVEGRCDRCPAAAAVRAQLPSGSAVMLCGHHGRRYEAALRAQGARVTGDLGFTVGAPAPAGAPTA
jgi:hypothetical protein